MENLIRFATFLVALTILLLVWEGRPSLCRQVAPDAPVLKCDPLPR